jgi:hypothetical protein
VVAVGDLRVVLFADSDQWIAQGLEIDYAAQGDSVDAAKAAFESGLAATLQENLRVFGKIAMVLRPAPSEVWQSVLLPGAVLTRHSQISLESPADATTAVSSSSLPFNGISYIQLADQPRIQA